MAKIHREKMLGMKNHFDINDNIEIPEVDIAGVACILFFGFNKEGNIN